MYNIDDTGVLLKPGTSLIIEIGEMIRMPQNVYGMVMPLGALFLRRGVLIASTKIDVAFVGRLKLRLLNTSPNVVRFHIGDKIASAVFFNTEAVSKELPFSREATAVERQLLWATSASVSGFGRSGAR